MNEMLSSGVLPSVSPVVFCVCCLPHPRVCAGSAPTGLYWVTPVSQHSNSSDVSTTPVWMQCPCLTVAFPRGQHCRRSTERAPLPRAPRRPPRTDCRYTVPLQLDDAATFRLALKAVNFRYKTSLDWHSQTVTQGNRSTV